MEVQAQLDKQQKELEESLKKQKVEEDKEKKEAEYLKSLEEEQKRKEEEEYNKWVGDIQEIEEGTLKEDESGQQSMLQTFIEYLRLRKVVPLDELGANFKLTTKDVIKRIKSLEEQDLITGVIDDRGKYIYINKKELIKVKEMIVRKGFISKVDLVSEVSRIISLEPSAEDLKKIKEQDQKLLETVNNKINSLSEEKQ